MSLMEQSAAMADAEVAHLARDASRIEAAATADRSTRSDLVKHCLPPGSQALSGNGRSLWQLALDHAHGVGEAQAIRIEPARPRGLHHELANREVR